MPKKEAGHVVSSESKLFAFLAYLLGILGFILVFLVRRHDAFAMYHAKQSLVLCIAGIIISIVAIMPVLGWIIWIIGWILIVLCWVIGIINALGGTMKPLPLIGTYGEQIKL